MYIFESPMANRLLTIASLEPVTGLSVWEGDSGDMNVDVVVADLWSFVMVIHPNDTVTKPAEADDITVTVTRP